ncbi:MAG TPA: prolipoprotein diacylglyceryl transferase [Chloroflexota bacterium]|nr:prolipoprotein diacylglyceryl transferase [Chloroflexota bacterium]
MPVAVIRIGLDPVLFHLGPLSVHWYGLAYVAGIVAGLQAAFPFAARLGINRDTAYQIFWPVLIGSLVGGRLYYVVQSDAGRYLRHPADILATWEGGMAFYGAVFLGAATAFVVCLIKRISFPVVLDVAAVFIPVAQTFGRVGNLINGDILGYPSTLPWATQYTNPNNTFVPSHTIAYDPAAAYELLFSALLFVVVWKLRDRFRVPGTPFTLWLVLYSAGQFFLFFLRANSVVWLGLKQAQLTAIVVVALAVPVWFAWRNWYRRADGNRTSPAVAGGTQSGASA